MPTHFAEALTAPEFGRFAGPQTIAVLPVAAIEPHGPHLPLSTDCDIARGHLAALPDHVAADHNVLVLPLQTIGHSLEHTGFAGLFTHEPELLLQSWSDLIAPAADAGVRKVIIVSSHGGNSAVASLLATRLRAERAMLAVSAAWLRFGQPDGLFDETELAYGIHGGAVETSLMLHYCPEKVRLVELADFASAAPTLEADTRWLKWHGRTQPGWLSRDLNAHGSVGNALAASAEKGAASAHAALSGFAQLLDDVAAFDMARME